MLWCVKLASGVWVRMVSRIRRPVASSWWIMSLCNNMGHWTLVDRAPKNGSLILMLTTRSKWKASQSWSWSVQGQRNYRGHDAGPRWWRSSCGGRRLGESRCHAVGHDSRHEYFWSPVRHVLIVSILPTLFNLFVSLCPLCNWKKTVTNQPLYQQAAYILYIHVYIYIYIVNIVSYQAWGCAVTSKLEVLLPGTSPVWKCQNLPLGWVLCLALVTSMAGHLESTPFQSFRELGDSKLKKNLEKTVRLDLHALRGEGWAG